MQKEVRIVGDQRYDLTDLLNQILYRDQELQAIYGILFSETNKVGAGWKLEDGGGLVARIKNSVDSLALNVESDTGSIVADEKFPHGVNYRMIGDPYLSITLPNNTVNYVELRLNQVDQEPKTVPLWDPTANSNVGEEFLQNSNTVTAQVPTLISNNVAFTDKPNTFRLAVVTTSGGAISSIVDSRLKLYNVTSDWDFTNPDAPGLTDRTIENFQNSFQALATAIRQAKGTTNWYDAQTPNIANINAKLAVFYDAVVGSLGQVASGIATHSSIQQAHDDLAAGSIIYVLPGTFTLDITLSKEITIYGKGHSSILDGKLTFAAGSSYSVVRLLKIEDDITIDATVEACFLHECWLASGKILTDNSGPTSGNSITIIQE